MNRKTMVSGPVGGSVLGILLAATGLARAQTPANDAQTSLRAPVRHAAVCPGPVAAGTARCHAHVVVNDSGRPLVTSGPSGYIPSDLRSAYNVTGTGSANTLIAIVDAYGYPGAESDLAVYRSRFGLPPDGTPCSFS